MEKAKIRKCIKSVYGEDVLLALVNTTPYVSKEPVASESGLARSEVLGTPSQNNSQWKGYSDVEPDAIFMYYLPDGRLRADVFEFKIGAGKPEAVPAEAYQLAKAKRSIEDAVRDSWNWELALNEIK